MQTLLSAAPAPPPRLNLAPVRGSEARVFAVAFAVSLLLLAVGPYTNVNPNGSLDPWFYTGYFQNFSEMVERYGSTYYVSRLPYVLPGVALYKIFSPAVANWVLNALLLTAIVAPLYLVIAGIFGRLAGLLAAIAAISNSYLVSTILWDYPDGPAIAFAMLGFWLYLGSDTRTPSRWGAAGAGAMWMMAGITNFIVVFSLVGLAATAALWHRRTLKELLGDAAFFALGSIACLAVWFGISKLTLGIWNLLGPQWGQVRHASDNKDYLLNMWGRGYEWIPEAFRLIPIVAAVILGLILVATRRSAEFPQGHRAALAAVIGLAISLACFAWMEFGMQKVLLRVSYHSSYLTSSLLVAVGALAGYVLSRLPTTWPRWAAFALVAACFAAPLISRAYWYKPFEYLPWLAGLLGGSLLLAVPRGAVACLGLAAFAALVTLAPAVDQVGARALGPKEALFIPDSSSKIVANRAAYSLELSHDLQVLLKNGGLRRHPLRFWFDRDEPNKDFFESLYAMFLWGESDVARVLQTSTPEQLRQFFPAPCRLVHLATDQHKIHAHRQRLEEAGLVWREMGNWTLGRRGQRYRIALDEVSFR